MATDALEARITHFEGAFDQMDKRLGSVEARPGSVETRLSSLEHQSRISGWKFMRISAVFGPRCASSFVGFSAFWS